MRERVAYEKEGISGGEKVPVSGGLGEGSLYSFINALLISHYSHRNERRNSLPFLVPSVSSLMTNLLSIVWKGE
jgi:hypothetical protein